MAAAAAERTMEAETSSSEPAAAEDLPGGGSGVGEDRLVMYRTKLVQFLGRSTPIVLQNDNGPCPLLAICNVLLLRNVITLSPDVPEVSQEQLLALVADRLLESNSDVKSKDEGYVSNQQQNISDAIDLLPRLATGIDVNVHFRKINDFEFTRECAIFDLLDIGLYHGWIVDPEDTGTVQAIGSKSYNTLVGELVALQAHSGVRSIPPEEDTVDFAAATAASLGIPSPCLSRGRSFDDHFPVPAEKAGRKGDLEEEEELLKVLSLSRSEFSTTPEPIEKSLSPKCSNTSSDIEEGTLTEIPGNNSGTVVSEIVDSCRAVPSTALLSSPDTDSHVTSNTETTSIGAVLENNDNETLKNGSAGCLDGPIAVHSVEISDYTALHSNIMTSQRSVSADAAVLDGSNIGHTNKSQVRLAEESSVETIVFDENISGEPFYPRNGTSSAFAEIHPSNKDISYSGGRDSADACQSGEPIYEGEECILDPVHLPYQNQEPVYEGEALLVNQVDAAEAGTTRVQSDKESSGDKLGSATISLEEGQLIYNFLESNASQLTIYGLFCLQDGLKERELCVFFRNNHFSTMFKFESELYLLATDQGYINQPDLVWEKLNEVNGDTVFMTGNFQEFRMDNQSDSWNRQNALTDTAQYLAELKKSSTEGSLSSDLQYAIQLQEQEFGQQPVCPEPQSPQHVPVARTGLVTGPQVPRRPPPAKQESKPKEKCVIM